MTRVVKKHFERKAEIVEAARYLIQTKDYEKMTLQDVMTRLGIAKGTIYHYFKSKEEIFLEVTGHDDLSYEVIDQVRKEDMPPLEAGSGGGGVVGGIGLPDLA